MPIYEYDCHACGHQFEELVLGGRKVCCPSCASENIERRMSTFSHKAQGGKYVSSKGSGCSGCTSSSCNSCH
jgi:putative FmdB family regulatory protein